MVLLAASMYAMPAPGQSHQAESIWTCRLVKDLPTPHFRLHGGPCISLSSNVLQALSGKYLEFSDIQCSSAEERVVIITT